MKKIRFYLCSLVLLVGLLASCSSAPEYGKMIPNDAFFVMSLNVDDAVEACELGEAKALKKQIDQSLAHAQLPQDMREQWEDILSDPSHSGIDLSKPVLAFASASFANRYGVIGAVSDADKLEDFLGILRKQGWCKEVMLRDGLRYAAFEDKGFILTFSEDWFLLTQQLDSQKDEMEVVNGVKLLAAQEEKASMMENPAFKEMHTRDGFLHFLFLGVGLEDVAKEMGFSEELLNVTLPEGVTISDFGLLCDASVAHGEVKFISETKPLSSAAEDWLDEIHENGKLNGNLVKYISQDAILYGFTSVQGKAIYQQLMGNREIAEMLAEDGTNKELAEKLLSDINGDLAFAVMPAAGEGESTPEYSLYAETDKGTWLDWVRNDSSSLIEKIDDRTFSINLPNPKYRSSRAKSGSSVEPFLGSFKFGMKKNISYVLLGKNPGLLESVVNPVTLDSELNGYMRLNAAGLLGVDMIRQKLGPLAYIPFKKLVGLFDYAEISVENGRKLTFRITMKNKEQSPVKTIYDEVEDLLSVLS